jgi:transcriptional regulator with XRE-family HTH domain
MSVSELARSANISRETITNVELHGQEPSADMMLAIANALITDPHKFFL